MNEIEKAIEVAKQEIKNLEHYLKLEDMRVIHEERMTKMKQSLQTLIFTAEKYVALQAHLQKVKTEKDFEKSVMGGE